jgi:uridine nucleosidase
MDTMRVYRRGKWEKQNKKRITLLNPTPTLPFFSPPDDALAIIAAFRSPEIEVIGLTTTFGNCETVQATRNAFVLLNVLGASVPVAVGSHRALSGAQHRVADFVHGKDGIGDAGYGDAPGDPQPVDQDAAAFIAAAVRASPGTISILALGPLTNIARALAHGDDVGAAIAEVVVLGGAFFRNGNVNPAAEANAAADPAAADAVFASRAPVRVVGLDVTHTCRLQSAEVEALAARGPVGEFAAKISAFYLAYHKKAYAMDAMYLHDPTALAALVAPSLFTWMEGAVVVATDGVLKGATVVDQGEKVWAAQKNAATNLWVGRRPARVATACDVDGVVRLVLDRLSR